MGIIDVIKTTGTNIKDGIAKMLTTKVEVDVQSVGDEDKKLMADYDMKIQESAQRKAPREKVWFTSIAFLLGHHWLQWDGQQKRFIEPHVPKWRVRLVCNKILPRYRKALNRLSTYDPGAVSTPNSSETEDIEAAQLGTKILRGLKDKLKVAKVMHRKNQWQLLCGTVFVHYYWNSGLGKKLPQDEELEQLERVNADNEELRDEISALKPKNKKPLSIGNMALDVCNAFEMYPIDDATTIETLRAMCRMRYVSLEEIIEKYPEHGKEVKPEGDDTTAGMYTKKIESLISTGSYSSPADNNDKALLKEIWERPSSKYPKGLFLAFANGILLEKGDLPDIDIGDEDENEFEMPFAEYYDLEVPGSFWGQSVIEQMIPLNKERNRSTSQIIESRNLMSKPKVISADGSVAKTAWTSEPGEHVVVKTQVPGFFQPYTLTPPSLPQYVLALPDLLDKDLGDVGAMHEVSLAQAPPGVKSGKGIRELKQSDEEELNPLFVQESTNKQVIYSALLKMAQAHYTEPRMIKLVGKDKTTEVVSFIGADLKNNTDVFVETTDIMPTNRAARQELIVDFYDKGMLGDPQNDATRKRALRMIEFGNIDEIWEEGSLDAKQQRNENKELAKGNLLEPQDTAGVMWYDDHKTHIMELMRVIKSPLFKSQRPDIQKGFEQHAKNHMDMDMGIHPANSNANINQPAPVAPQVDMATGQPQITAGV